MTRRSSPLPRTVHRAVYRDVVVRDGERTLLEVPELVLDSPRIAVVGPNGSGKSTLLRLLNGLAVPDEGTVTLETEAGEVDVAEDLAGARSHVGFVFSDPLAQLLLPTPLEDVRLSLRSLRGEAQRSAALAWLERCSAAHLAEQSVYELSSGERQRVALASVLAAEPGLLVLDEPTTLLDRLHTRRLEALVATLDVPVLMATHDLEVASRFPRALAVDGGRVVEDGPAAEVVRRYSERADAEEL